MNTQPPLFTTCKRFVAALIPLFETQYHLPLRPVAFGAKTG
jgi:hypothetical protein